CGGLSQKLDRRENALMLIESAHIELARAMVKEVMALKKKLDKNSLKSKLMERFSLISPSTSSEAIATLPPTDMERLQNLAKDLIDNKKLYNKTRKSIFDSKRLHKTPTQ